MTVYRRVCGLTPENAVLYHNLGKTYFLMAKGRPKPLQKARTLDKVLAQQLYEVIHDKDVVGRISP